MGKKLREGSKQKPRAGRSHNVKRVFEAKTIGFPPQEMVRSRRKGTHCLVRGQIAMHWAAILLE